MCAVKLSTAIKLYILQEKSHGMTMQFFKNVLLKSV